MRRKDRTQIYEGSLKQYGRPENAQKRRFQHLFRLNFGVCFCPEFPEIPDLNFPAGTGQALSRPVREIPVPWILYMDVILGNRYTIC